MCSKHTHTSAAFDYDEKQWKQHFQLKALHNQLNTWQEKKIQSSVTCEAQRYANGSLTILFTRSFDLRESIYTKFRSQTKLDGMIPNLSGFSFKTSLNYNKSILLLLVGAKKIPTISVPMRVHYAIA